MMDSETHREGYQCASGITYCTYLQVALLLADDTIVVSLTL